MHTQTRLLLMSSLIWVHTVCHVKLDCSFLKTITSIFIVTSLFKKFDGTISTLHIGRLMLRSYFLAVQTQGEATSLVAQENVEAENKTSLTTPKKAPEVKPKPGQSRNSDSARRQNLVNQNQNQNARTEREIPTIEVDSHLVEDLAHTLTKEFDQPVDIWSNESLASNSSIGKVDMLDFTENEALEGDENVGENFADSGSGEALSEMDFDANSSVNSGSLGQSWRVVRKNSVSKPPNILVYTSKVDSARNFERVKEVLEKVVDKDCYVIYHLKVEEVDTTPWMDNTVLLVLVKGNKHTGESPAFLKYFQNGGKILGLGSGFDTSLVGRTELRPEYWISELSYESFSKVTLVAGRFAYKTDQLAVEDITVSKLGVDSENNAMIVKVSQKSQRTNGCAILSQVSRVLDKREYLMIIFLISH